jgi:beta-mannosidase
VEIRNAEDNLILSDNFFDLNAGEKRIKVHSGALEGISLRSTFDIH